MNRHKQNGMTLIELMVALAIGAFLMIGAITVFMQSRTTFRVTESLSRLQENARIAIEIMEPDIRMAHYWGLTTTTASIANRAGPAAGAFPGLTASMQSCGNNWVVNFDQAVSGSNNSFGLGCFPLAAFGPVEANADTVVVRRVAEDAETLPLAGAGTPLRLLTVRGTDESRIFTGNALPAGFNAATNRIHRVIVNGYYVSRSSSATTAGINVVPSLRVRSLQPNGTVLDQELIAGVEDLQVQFGIDTDPPDADNRGSIDRYVNVNDPLVEPFNPASNVEILSVRIWLRVRAERLENGFRDTAIYQYADQNVGPFNDAFRRMVVSKTIYLRNARPAS